MLPPNAVETTIFAKLWQRPMLTLMVSVLFCFCILSWQLHDISIYSGELRDNALAQRMAGRIARACQMCRRYEKDAFLNIADPPTRERYLDDWRRSYAAMVQEIELLPTDNASKANLRQLTADYRRHFLRVMDEIEAGKIATPNAANLSFAPYKSSARQISTETQQVFEATAQQNIEAAVALRAHALVNVTGALFLVAAPFVLAMLGFRVYNQRLVAVGDRLRHYAEELSSRQRREREAMREAVQARQVAEDAFEEIAGHKAALERSERQFRALVNNIPGVSFRCLLDEAWTMLFMSHAARELTGYDAADFLGNRIRTFNSIIDPEDAERVRAAINEAVAQQRSYQVGYRLVRADGEIRHVREQGQVSRNEDPDSEVPAGALMIDGALFDVSDLKVVETQLLDSNERFERASLTDRLTDLPNRELFLEQLRRAMQRSRETGRPTYGVLFLDFDRFKLINDSLGHNVGDALLIEISRRLQSYVDRDKGPRADAGGSSAARFGGDEFVVLLDGVERLEQVEWAAEQLLGEFAKPIQLGVHEVQSTVSIGIVLGELHCADPEEVLRDADTAMYEAKRAGKGRYVVFDASMRESVLRHMKLDTDLRKAVERGELELHYQPIVSLSDGEVYGVEGLLRWRHPEEGMIGPVEFIPIAEESHQIIDIGQFVLREGCEQLAEWIDCLGAAAPHVMSLNLSRVQLACPDLPGRIQQLLEEFQLPAERLQLELTEDAVATDMNIAMQTMRAIQKLGVRLAIDDFGTGYSSFASLHQFPVDVLKVDRSLVLGIQESQETASLVHALADLVTNLGIELVSEGVEELGQVVALRELGCNLGQGYYFSPALPAEAFEAFLIQHLAGAKTAVGALTFASRWEDRLPTMRGDGTHSAPSS